MSGRNGGFDEGYQLTLPVGFIGLASCSGGSGVHGGASGGSLIAAVSSGGHGEEGQC